MVIYFGKEGTKKMSGLMRGDENPTKLALDFLRNENLDAKNPVFLFYRDPVAESLLRFVYYRDGLVDEKGNWINPTDVITIPLNHARDLVEMMEKVIK